MKKKHIRRIFSGLCAAVMAITTVVVPLPISELSLETYAHAEEVDETTVSRAEWISSLVRELANRSEVYPDNYFSDITEDYTYYDDIMNAVSFGLIDAEAGDKFNPESPAERDFAAHSLNIYLGLEKASDTYSFNDFANTEYKNDAQVAVEQGWLALEGGKFLPDKSITRTEMNAMLAAISAASREIDPDYNSTYTFAAGVVEVPNGTDVDITFIDDDEIVSITDSPKSIPAGSVFVVYYNDYPCIYKAKSVSVADGVTTIVTEETDRSAAVVSMDMQTVSPVDIMQFEGAEGSETYYIETEEQARSMSMSRGIKVNKNSVIVDYTYKITSAVSFSLSACISNIRVNSWGSITNHIMSTGDSGVEVNGDITLTGTVKGDLLSAMGAPKSISLGSVRVAGVGKISLDLDFKLSASGKVTYSGGFCVGVRSSNGKMQFIKNFYQTGFNSAIEAEADVGLSLKASVDLIIFKGSVSANVGIHGKFVSETYTDGKNPERCSTASAYLYAYFAADAKFLSKQYHSQYDLFTAKNSPIKVYYHFEDGKLVPQCTRGGTSKTPYLTAWDSPYFSTHYAGSGSGGWNKYGEPYSIFEYELDEDGNATITKYSGNVSYIFIPEKLDGHTVTKIGWGVFSDCAYLTSVSFPDTIVEIGDWAFENCTKLHNITLPQSLTALGKGTFMNCDSLTTITIPKNLKNVNTDNSRFGPFVDCDNLTNVTFEKGFNTVPHALFGGCTGLKEITIPDTVTVIEYGAFYECENLETVNLSSNLTVIEGRAFYECENLETVIFSTNLTQIGDWAFEDCTKLHDVSLPKSLAELGKGAFYNCDSLTTITIPKNLKNVNTDNSRFGPFVDCDNLANVTFEKGFNTVPYALFGGCTGLKEVTIPDTVTVIEGSAFNNCENLETVNLSTNLTQIGDWTFEDCTKLHNITLPQSLTTLGKGTFWNCDSLTTITIPKNLKNVNTDNSRFGPFVDCDNLTNVTFEKGFNTVPHALFGGCTGLKEITIPDTVTVIEYSAFSDCENLETVNLPKNLEFIGDYVFTECKSLISIELPDTIKGTDEYGYPVYPNSLFSGCESLKTVKLHKDLPQIGKEMFYGCKSLESIEIPENVTAIYWGAFNECESIKNVTVPKNVKTIWGSAFANCTVLSEITLEGTEEIWDNAFSNCIALEKVSLPDTLTKIGYEAFKGCTALPSIVIPNSVKTIGDRIFYECEALKDVTISGFLTEIPEEAFRYCYELESITIPNSVTKIGSLAFGENITLTDVYFGSKISEIADNAFSYPQKMTFHGPRGTRAETYAAEKDITFEEAEAPEDPEDPDNPDDSTKVTVKVHYNREDTTGWAIRAWADGLDAAWYTFDDNGVAEFVTPDIDTTLFIVAKEDWSEREDGDANPYDPATNMGGDRSIDAAKVIDGVIDIYVAVGSTTNAYEPPEEPEEPTEVVIPVEIKAPETGAPDTSDMTVAISGNGVSVNLSISEDGKVELSVIADGEYTFTFSAKNCAPRAYDVTVSDGSVNGLEDGVELHLYGDIDGDGKVNMKDVGKANAHAKNTAKLSDYDLSVSDINGDGKINMQDVGLMNAHAKNTKSLW